MRESMETTSMPASVSGSGMSSPSTLPPPYTSTGTRAGSLRKVARKGTKQANAASFTTTAELLIGPKPTKFLLHTTLLTSQSPYFRAALTGPFLESTSQTLTLPDISVDTFELLVSWLYTSTLSPPPFKDGKPAYYTLLHVYILADRLCFEALRNYIVDLISDLADSTNSVLTPSDTRILYEQIGEGARIRELVLDLFAFKKTDKLLASHTDRWHAGFLRDLVVRLKKPCKQAMQRHRLRMWCPESWHATRACDVCRVLLAPRYGAVGCDECCCAWCVRCVGEGVAVACWEDGRGGMGAGGGSVDEGEAEESTGSGGAEGKVMGRKRGGWTRKWESCKPWRGARCRIYHEHAETEACADVFMGR